MGGGRESCAAYFTRSDRVYGWFIKDAVWEVCDRTRLRIYSDGFPIRMDWGYRTRSTRVGFSVFTRSAGGVVGCRGVDEEAIRKRRVSQKRLDIFLDLLSLVSVTEEYNEMRERLEKANEEIIGSFVNHAVETTKRGKHRMAKYASQLQFFSNEYLINYHEYDLLEGLECFPEFIGNWFIRKCMWSDEASLRENIEGFKAFLGYLEETKQVQKERLDELRQHIDDESHLYLLRVKYFNDPEIDFDDILDECGWDDDALLSFEKQQAVMPEIPKIDQLVLNLLLSAKVAKFFKFKPPEIIKLKD